MTKLLLTKIAKFILLCPMMMVLIFTCTCCKTENFTMPDMDKITILKERDVPIFTEMVDISAKGKINIDDKGKLRIDEPPKISSNSKKKPKINVDITPEGQLTIDVTLAADTTYVAVQDSETTIKKAVFVEKELTFLQRLYQSVGKIIMFAILILGSYKIFRKFKR